MGKVVFGEETRSNVDNRIDVSDGNAVASDVVNGKIFYNSSGRQVGTLENKSNVNAVLGPGESVTVEAGTYNEDSSISAKTLAQVTGDADAVAADIRKNKTAYINGEKVVGTLDELDTSDADAVSSDILSGKTAYVNGVKVTGNLSPIEDLEVDEVNISTDEYGTVVNINSGDDYIAPDSEISVEIDRLLPNNIRYGIDVEVADKVITGVFTGDATALKSDILSGKTAGISGSMLTGSMPDMSRSVDDGGNADGYKDGSSETLNKGISSSTGKLGSEDYIAIKVPTGYYNSSWVYVKLSDVISDLNISPNVILEGNTILGVEGSIKNALTDGITLSESNLAEIIKSNLVYDVKNSDNIRRVCFKIPSTGVVQDNTYIAVEEGVLAQSLHIDEDKLLNGYNILGVSGKAKLPQITSLYVNSKYDGESYTISYAEASAFDYIKVEVLTYTDVYGNLMLNNSQLQGLKGGKTCGYSDRGEEVVSIEGTNNGIVVSSIFGYGFNVVGLKNID